MLVGGFRVGSLRGFVFVAVTLLIWSGGARADNTVGSPRPEPAPDLPEGTGELVVDSNDPEAMVIVGGTAGGKSSKAPVVIRGAVGSPMSIVVKPSHPGGAGWENGKAEWVHTFKDRVRVRRTITFYIPPKDAQQTAESGGRSSDDPRSSEPTTITSESREAAYRRAVAIYNFNRWSYYIAGGLEGALGITSLYLGYRGLTEPRWSYENEPTSSCKVLPCEQRRNMRPFAWGALAVGAAAVGVAAYSVYHLFADEEPNPRDFGLAVDSSSIAFTYGGRW
jgi:hypothetical protein